jgi:Ca2+-binding EF-hand superfamily protein
VTDEEADALFDAMDADGGGDLDLGELKSALKRMQASPTRTAAAPIAFFCPSLLVRYAW